MKKEKILKLLLEVMEIDSIDRDAVCFKAKTKDGVDVEVSFSTIETEIKMSSKAITERTCLSTDAITAVYAYGYSNPYNTLKIATKITTVELELEKPKVEDEQDND